MNGEEDDEGCEALEDGEPEAPAEPTYVESSVDTSKLVEAVFREFEDLLDPSQWPFAWQWWRRSPEAR